VTKLEVLYDNALMLSALVATLALLLAQDDEANPSTSGDRIVDLVISADDELLIEGHGPTVVSEYEVEFDGTLHVWTTSELDLFLQVADAEARVLASDDNSGGGTTPYLGLEVKQGDGLTILVAGAPDATGSLTLHLIAAPATETGRAAVRVANAAVRDAARLAKEGQRAEARELMAKALSEVANPVGFGHPDLLLARANLAIALRDAGDLAGARALRESVLAGHERTLPADHPQLLAARGNLATSLAEMGDLSGARALEEAVLAAFERSLPEDHPNVLRARANLAISMIQMGDLAAARVVQEAVLAALERSLPEDHLDLLRARANLANLMHEMGDLVAAHALKESLFAAYERSLPEDHPDRLRAQANLANSTSDIGDLAGARTLREAVLAAYERTLPEDHPDLLRAQANLALSMHDMGDLAEGRALHEAVVAAYERTLPQDHPQLLWARANLANSMSQMGDLAGARALRQAVLAGYERTLPEDHPELLLARGNLASSMSRMGDLAGARALRESVLAACERTLPEDHPDRLRARGSLASSMIQMGDHAGAGALLESVLAAYEHILPEDHPHLLWARANLASSMSQVGDLAGARALLPELVAGMRKRVLTSMALAPRQARQTVGSESRRLSEVLFLSATARSELGQSVFELTESMRLVAAEAARSLARFETDPELAPILEEAAQVRRTLNDLVAGAAREAAREDGLPAELMRLSLERDALEREANRRLAERGVVAQPVSTEALSAALASGDVAVGYRRIALKHFIESTGEIEEAVDHLLAHVLTSEGTLTRVDLGPASELEGLANQWRAALGAPLLRGIALEDGADDEPELDAGRALRARILDPVLKLAGEDAERLFVCADDLLFLLPLDALPLEASDTDRADVDAERIGDRLRIVNEISFARLMGPTRQADAAPSLLVLGGVDYSAQGVAAEGLVASSAPLEAGGDSRGGRRPNRFQKLLQTRYEAEATANIFEEAFELEADLLLGKDTTKAALFESATGKRYLHLATHGWFAPESVRSTEDAQAEGHGFAGMGIEERVSGLAPMTLCGLALAGANNGRDSLGRVPGILTAEELCSLDLSQCELAVLSACETNVGIRRAGQGIQSLQSALYASGAHSSITSLWKVDDAATRRLMEAFYTNLWIEKLGKAEALWRAKQVLRDDGSPPAHWAGWLLTGDPE
jgi:hypothetical protein